MNLENSGIEFEGNSLLSSIRLDIPNQTNQRLIINKIAMENFKSYYGRLEIGCFHRRFTAIVGPNGSGKSNLIESLLFVFGKRANWMRLKSLHQLIHNSSQHSDIKKASVEVEFMEVEDQGKDNIIEIPKTKFTVKRTVHHTGQTNYHINDNHATLEEVTTLLQAKGIDLTNNRFLILQGEVEQISLMKPKSGDLEKPGLLEYLEDIIGSGGFQPKIEELVLEYERIDTIRRERGEVMRIVEGEMIKLQPAKDKAIEFVRREKQAWQLQNIQFQVQQHKHKILKDRLTKENANLDQEYIEFSAQSRESLKKDLESTKLVQELQKKQRNIIEKIQITETQYNEINEQDSRALTENKSLTEQEVKCKRRINDIIKERNSMNEEVQELQQILPNSEKTLNELQNQREIDEKRYQQLEIEHREATQSQLNEKKRLSQKINPQLNQRQTLQSEIEVLQKKLDLLQKQKVNISNKTAEINKVQGRLKQDRNQQAELQEIINKLRLVRQRIASAKEDEEKQLKKIYDDIRFIDNEIMQLKGQMQNVQQTHQRQNEQEKTIKAILDASARGQLSGIIGRLGDLGWIPKEYDVAVSTVAIGGLNSILVESDEAAQKAINFLKAQRIGRCTFISLKRVTDSFANEMNQKVNTPQRTQRLIDLIKCRKEEYKPAFCKTFFNTLVAENLEIANDVKYKQKLYQKYKIVTLDGKVINEQGIISGGGQVKTGAMCTSVNMQNSVNKGGESNAECKQQLEKLMQSKSELEQMIQQVKAKIIEFEREQQQVNKALNEREQDLNSITEQIEENTQQIQILEEQKQKNTYLEQEINQVNKKIDEQTKQLHIIEESYKVEQQQINQILEKIQSLQSDEFKKLKDNLANQTRECENLEQSVNKQKHQILNLTKRLKKLDSEEEDCLKKQVEIKGKIQNLLKYMAENEVKTKFLLEQLQSAQQQEQQVKLEYEKTMAEHKEYKEKLDQIKQRIHTIKEKKEGNSIAIQKCSDELKDVQKRLDYARKAYRDSLREYDFLDDFENIANAHVLQNNDISLLGDMSMLNISMVEETMISRLQIDENDDGEELKQLGIKRRSNIIAELQTILEYDVTQDLVQDQIERFVPIEKEIARAIAGLQAKANDLSKDTNILDITNFKNKFQDFKDKKQHLDDIKEQLAKNKSLCDKMKKDRYDMFIKGFSVISTKLRETYQTLTNGGDAELDLVDSMDPFSEGVSFSVRPKNKSWKQMSKLSGGEKTLASLSLIFALHYYRPTPLYFFDEVDAALDYRNVAIVGNFIKERTQNAQFIVISLRNNMFELANKLVGIYKTYDMTKSITIQPQLVTEKINSKSQNQENSRNLANKSY